MGIEGSDMCWRGRLVLEGWKVEMADRMYHFTPGSTCF
jgi:hypothetical protein